VRTCQFAGVPRREVPFGALFALDPPPKPPKLPTALCHCSQGQDSVRIVLRGADIGPLRAGEVDGDYPGERTASSSTPARPGVQCACVAWERPAGRAARSGDHQVGLQLLILKPMRRSSRHSSQRRRPVSAAFSTVQAPRSSTRVRVLSIVTLRLVRILMGLSARASAASRPAMTQVRRPGVEEPNGQHASQCLGQEDADRVEAKNLGAGRLQPEAHRGLSIETKPPGSSGKKELCQLSSMLLMAAG